MSDVVNQRMLKSRHPNRLRAVRLAQGMNRKELARRTGLHFVTVYRHETGKHAMTGDSQRRYAEALQVSVSALYIQDVSAET